MGQKAQIPIREFSRLSGINRDNLRFYDRIGLLCPETRGENRYRYYSRRQLGSAYLISNLRELEIGLAEIKRYSVGRTPERMLSLFAQQEERIAAEIERLHEISEMMQLYSDMAKEALAHGESDVLLQERVAEPLFFCPTLDDRTGVDEGMVIAYDYAAERGINLGYPLGATVSREQLGTGENFSISRYYFKSRQSHNAQKPAGLYATAYGRCDPMHPEEVYRRLLGFLAEQRLTPISDAYEECLLDDMSVEDSKQNCVRVEVQVKYAE